MALAIPAFAASTVSSHTTIGVFLQQADRLGGRTFLNAFQQNTWRSISWDEARQHILRVAAGLVGAGLQVGDAVMLLSQNRAAWILCDLAIQAAGGITVPVYPTLTAATTQQIAADSQAVIAVVASELIGKVTPSDRLRRLVDMDTELQEWMAHDPATSLVEEVVRRVAGLSGQDVATIIYTSGTTGDPKGVVIPHENFVAMAAAGMAAFTLGPEDVLLSLLPYSHVFERVSGIFTPLSAGATIWISRGATQLLDDIAIARPTLMMAVPRMFEKMVDRVEAQIRREPFARRLAARWALGRRPGHHLIDRLVLPKLRRRLTGGRLRFFISGGAPLDAHVEGFLWAIGVPVYQGWGLTETTSAACANRPGANRSGTVGQPLPGVDVRLASDGELLVRGPGVMREYFHNPGATAEAFDGGWFRTGDIGAIDEAGYVTITDRKKDLIKTAGGKYVAPQPLETRLERNRYIAAAVIVGDRRPFIGAVILPDWDNVINDQHLDGTPEQLVKDDRVNAVIKAGVDALNRQLASFETIKRFRLVWQPFTEENGQMTPSLKVRRHVVEMRYQRLIDEMYGAPRDGTRSTE